MRPTGSLSVLHVVPSLAARYGGPTAAVRGLVRVLAERGVRCAIVTISAQHDEAENERRNELLTRRSVEIRQFSRTGPLPARFGFSRGLRSWLHRSVDAYDLVHVHGVFTYPGLAAARVSRRLSKPFILSPHGMLGPWSLRQKAWKKKPYLHLIESLHLRTAAMIHATTRREEQALRGLGLRTPIRTVGLGVDLAAGGTNRRSRDGRLRVLFLSRLHEVKGLPLLFEAMQQATLDGVDLELAVAGAGEPEYEAELRQLAQRLGVAGRTRFLGWVDGRRKASLFEASDIFVLPSHSESFGMAVAEALAAGLPVVLTPGVGIAADVAAASAGLVVERDPARLAAALRILALDKSKREQMGVCAARLAKERFSWNSAALGIESMYESALRRTSAFATRAAW